jgi:hypothetical protein
MSNKWIRQLCEEVKDEVLKEGKNRRIYKDYLNKDLQFWLEQAVKK